MSFISQGLPLWASPTILKMRPVAFDTFAAGGVHGPDPPATRLLADEAEGIVSRRDFGPPQGFPFNTIGPRLTIFNLDSVLHGALYGHPLQLCLPGEVVEDGAVGRGNGP